MTTIAMKVYDLAWYDIYGQDVARAANALREDGVDIVLTQNQYDPLPVSGVDQRKPPNKYSDRKWTESLRQEGMTVFQTTAAFFDPPALERFPNARPLNALGQLDKGFDWYTGICPTDEDYLEWKTARLERVIGLLEFDGYFFQFARWPGFWENFVPEHRVSRSDQYCFCDRCRASFAQETNVDLHGSDLEIHAKQILEFHSEAWTAWRAHRLKNALEMLIVGSGIHAERLATMLNTVPFPANDFEGADVRQTIFGQDLAQLEQVFGHFELMTYLQILNRPPEWIADAVADARSRSDIAQVVCTLQVSPLYTEGIHAGQGRCATITTDDLERAANIAFESGVDGLVFYHWGDFLDDEANGGTKRDALRRIARKAKEAS